MQYAEAIRDEIREFLRRECGLELSVEKTHVTHIQDGYEFLGFRLSREIGQSGKHVPKINVGLKALRNVWERLNEAMRYRPHQESVAMRIQRGSAVVRGWANYFCIAHNFTDLAGTLDHVSLWTALKAICRKLDIPTGTAMKRFYRNGGIQVDEACRLEQFTGKPMKLDYRGPDGQINQYVLGARAIGHDVSTVLYDATRKPTIRRNEMATLTVGSLCLDEGENPHVKVVGRHAKSAKAATLPLRADLADEMRKHIASLATARRRPQSSPLPPETPLFHVDWRNLLRTLNLDIAAAGIPKVDAQGRTVDVHGMRHTFATLMARSGVMPATAQKLMRHSDIRLTMNIYTHLDLADTAGAVAALPTF